MNSCDYRQKREQGEGGFQLEFVSISRVINHMTCYKFECSHWWKFIKKNPLQDLLSSLNAGHVIYNPAYTYKFHLITTKEPSKVTR